MNRQWHRCFYNNESELHYIKWEYVTGGRSALRYECDARGKIKGNVHTDSELCFDEFLNAHAVES